MSPDASWNFAPGVVIALLTYAAVYVWRWRQCRTPDEPHPPEVWRLLVFLLGIAILAIALMSPVDTLGEQILAMHMVQHMLLLDVAPILIILGFTKVLLRPATRWIHKVETRVWLLAAPIFAVFFYTAAMWVWHIPALYNAAAEHSGVHVLEHLTFSTAGFLYWWHLLSPVSTRLRRDGMTPIVYMLSTKVTVGFLGILLTFAPEAIYEFYENQPEFWGLSPTSDQALAGAIMAIEQAVVMGIAIAFLFVRMLNEADKADVRAERFADREAQKAAQTASREAVTPGEIGSPHEIAAAREAAARAAAKPAAD
ncbi:cytochrome c oxidase assembly protein [Conexibacter sp. JD483]|uniref:cytochrome c oxidase assembly protein n=1 Tax=unclassified Conexibacter TaxID=2627773 RepID=UPI00271D681E|nr:MULTISPECIES: cytochrome c oxidase assembly protein [unclassified Conexibacter]MDO8186778.1 cytochrome c oxidase assembly protein [Conexibacter sp. CPCC 205706]MDO8199064.1 cytochrome c oxidase assembly protein [Conexibacter sp. CPCC 205762]MDR9368516.1 cytochrome c oxidase assembly protein [Conexibacter sp. JD483]